MDITQEAIYENFENSKNSEYKEIIVIPKIGLIPFLEDNKKHISPITLELFKIKGLI